MTFTNTKRKCSRTEGKLLEFLGNVSVSRYLLVTSLLCVHYQIAESVLNEKPKDAIVIANHSTFFNCSKSNYDSSINSQELTWYHHPLGGVKPEGVYEDGRIRDKYKDRFIIDRNLASGIFNLLVERPESKDSGRYRCVEDVLTDQGASAELIILDSNLECEFNKEVNEVVGQTECAKPIAPDTLQLICSVTYSGNMPPQMEWKKVGSELLTNETTCDVRDNRVLTCNATVESNSNMAGSVYICQIKTAEQYSCSLKDNNFIYTSSDTSVRAVTTKEEVVCSAITSVGLPCTYKWNKDNRTVTSGKTLKPSDPGKYSCEAECKIRNEICAFTAMVINVSESDTGNLNVLWLLLLIVLLGVIISATAYYLWKRYGDREEQAISSPDITLEQTSKLLLNPQNGSDDTFGKAFQIAPFISRGLSGGEIHGPMQYDNRQCTCERIKFTNDQHTQTNDVEMTKTEQILSNCQRWEELDHNNLLKFYDVIVESQDVFVMMEYAAGGSVRNALTKCAQSEVNLEMPVIKDWATQIAQGMEHLHKSSIVYKNLDSFRIHIMGSFEASHITNKTLKISQFCLIEDNFTSTQLDQKFSFMAPEVFDGIYDKAGDAWSFGIVIWEMLTNRIPYTDVKALAKITQDIRNGATVLVIPVSCPKALAEILKGCRRMTPSERPSFTEIVESLQAWQPMNSPV